MVCLKEGLLRIRPQRQFLQVELHPYCKNFNAVRAVFGILQYISLPMQTKNAPETFQRVVNKILGERKENDVLASMEGTTVCTIEEYEHLESIAIVLDRLLMAGVRLKISKCTFWARRAEFLGHRVDQDGLKLSYQQTEAVRRLAEPASLI